MSNILYIHENRHPVRNSFCCKEARSECLFRTRILRRMECDECRPGTRTLPTLLRSEIARSLRCLYLLYPDESGIAPPFAGGGFCIFVWVGSLRSLCRKRGN